VTLVGAVLIAMEYQLVFDLRDAGYEFPVIGLMLIAVGAVMMIASRGRHPFAVIYFWSSVLLTAVAFVGSYHRYATLTAAAAAGRADVIKGVVSKFRPAARGSHAWESFCVGTTCFRYSRSDTRSFSNTAATGGRVVRDGLPVRVTHVDNTIVRFEMAESEERKSQEQCHPPFWPLSCL